jgi:hypothetical protein
MPGSPLRIACVRPAPKSRFVVSGLAWEKINGTALLIVPTLRVGMQCKTLRVR